MASPVKLKFWEMSAFTDFYVDICTKFCSEMHHGHRETDITTDQKRNEEVRSCESSDEVHNTTCVYISTMFSTDTSVVEASAEVSRSRYSLSF